MTPKLRIVLGIVVILLVAAVPLIALAQTATPTPGSAFVMVGNFSPDSPPVDIYINNQLIGDNLSFSQATFPVSVTAGSIFIVVRDAAAAVTDPPIVDGYKDVGQGEYYMVPVMNIRQRAQFGAYRIPVFEALGTNETRVQFFHAVPEGPRLDVLNATTRDKVVNAMGYVEDPFVVDHLVAGVFNWQVWTNYRVIFPGFQENPNPPPDALIIDMGQLDLKARVIYSFFVIGSPTANPSVRALVLAMPYGGGQPVAPPSFPGSVGGPTPTGPTPRPSRTPTPTRTPTPGPATATPTGTTQPAPVVSFATSSLSINEGNSPFGMTVQLSRVASSTVTVQYTISTGSASTADYGTPTSGTLTFTAGVTTQTISLPIVNDTLDEDDETFTLTLTNPSGATLGTSVATGTIDDNDATPTLSITNVTVDGVQNLSVAEGKTAILTVTLSTASGRTVTARYQPAVGFTGTGGEGLDFNIQTQSNGTFILNFAPGDTTETFSVSVVADGAVEVPETFTLQLQSPSNANVVGGNGLNTGTVILTIP